MTATVIPITARGPAGAVLTTARRDGPIFRDELATATGLSHATVNRQVAALLEAGLLRERPDLVAAGAVGRPRVPVEVDPDRFGVLGVHIGPRHATLASGDLRGRVLDAIDVPVPAPLRPAEVIPLLTGRLRRFGARSPRRRPLGVGVVIDDQLRGGRAPLAQAVDMDLDAVVMPQVEAMAAAETLLTRFPTDGATLYVYARESVGAVLTVDDVVAGPSRGPGTISHLPVGGPAGCPCGATGCLEASVGDTAVAARAHRAGLVPEPSIAQLVAAAERGARAAHELLVERARLLGRGVALARDVFNPDRVALLGRAFTGYRPALAHVAASFNAASVLEPLSLRVSSLGPRVHALTACTAALRPIYADPLAAVRKADARAKSRVAVAP
ncbi:ROK family transcriptional regulator [Pseudonocardia acaciae]|uniref:ROK family transcriptional regulator n=1 Tax=Pseudonocardia acaciae TaxID=551276 RepID=UPI0006844E6D|nr:ROK family transcriptional regulator [Pseudonocardia acaciae]